MGRGRQKAKQKKVARALKYNVPDTNYAALERELTTQGGLASSYASYSVETDEIEEDEDEEEYDPYAKWADLDDEDDEEN